MMINAAMRALADTTRVRRPTSLALRGTAMAAGSGLLRPWWPPPRDTRCVRPW